MDILFKPLISELQAGCKVAMAGGGKCQLSAYLDSSARGFCYIK